MKGGILCKKKEMTRLWIDGKMVPVTLLAMPSQEVVRYKTQEKDGYDAVVIGLKKKNWFGKMVEFAHDDSFADAFAEWTLLSESLLDGVETLTIVGVSKGKGYQGGMKRFNLAGGEQTHGSKFHRQIGSLGNRKPRRVQKGHPHAGHMGTDRVTLHKRPMLEVTTHNDEKFIVVKGSVPWAYNDTVQVILK